MQGRYGTILGAGAAGAVGVALAIRPVSTAVVVLAVCTIACAVARRFRSADMYLSVFGLVLLGYAFLGRGFASVGMPPVYVGEIALALGALVAVFTGRLPDVLRSPLTWLLIVFCVWGAARTLPYVGVYGIDALRDAALWGYGAFAVIVACCLRRQDRSKQIARGFSRCIPWFVVWVPIAWGLVRVAGDAIPTVPGTDVHILAFNPGHIAVHLAGAAAFVLLDLRELPERRTRVRAWLAKWSAATCWALATIIAASITRSGMLAMMAAATIATISRPLAVARKLAGGAVFASTAILLAPLLFVGAIASDNRAFEESRVVSPQQIVANIVSTFTERDDDLEGTRLWRLEWWRTIVDYTAFGDYFWTGKGFGVNLADDDGFETTVTSEDRPNRSPHSGHLTVLARAGVPGLVMWVALQLGFAAGMTRAYFRARRQRRDWHARFALWILAYWTAFIIQASFDVFLEGPHAGIWFWGLFGVGIAILRQQAAAARASGAAQAC